MNFYSFLKKFYTINFLRIFLLTLIILLLKVPSSAFAQEFVSYVHRFDPQEGIEQIEELRSINEQIERGDLTLADLEARQWIIKDSRPVKHQNTGQSMPFTTILFPKAHTGIYVHNAPVTDVHKAIIMLLPGQTTTKSNALTVIDLAGKLHKVKSRSHGKHVQKVEHPLNTLGPNNTKVRFAAFPMDLPLANLGKDAPFSFGSPKAVVQSVRHVHLILRLKYPDRPVFIAGRSQGGLVAIHYVQAFNDVAGAIAMNPAHPDSGIVKRSLAVLNDPALLDIMIAGADIDPKSFAAHEVFTHRFSINRQSLAPTLLLLGGSDPSYPPQEVFFDAYKSFARQQPDHRRVMLVEQGEHNLWNNKNVPFYTEIVRAMGKFMLSPKDYNVCTSGGCCVLRQLY